MAEEAVVETETQTEEKFEPVPLTDLFGSKPSAPESKAEETEEKVEHKEDAGTEETDHKEEEELVKVDWDAEDNPWKSKASEFEKRYKDTQNWGFKAHQQLKELGLEVEKAPSEQEQQQFTAFVEREKASLAMAVAQYGKEHIQKTLYDVGSPIEKIITEDPSIYQRIFNAPAPVMEALKIVKQHEFFNKYAPDGNLDNVSVNMRKEIEKEIRDEITKEFKEKISKKEKLPNTIRQVTSKDSKENESFKPTPLKHLFG
jgi:hypothetical protein